jgi:hypothetical protein
LGAVNFWPADTTYFPQRTSHYWSLSGLPSVG